MAYELNLKQQDAVFIIFSSYMMIFPVSLKLS